MEYSVSIDGKILYDMNVHLHHFSNYIVYACINCDKRLNSMYCDKCKYRNGHNKLLLSTYYKGIHIWAYNGEHLDYLEAFIKADIRIQKDKYTHSLLSNLPSIYKTKKYRKDMLRKISELRSKL